MNIAKVMRRLLLLSAVVVLRPAAASAEDMSMTIDAEVVSRQGFTLGPDQRGSFGWTGADGVRERSGIWTDINGQRVENPVLLEIVLSELQNQLEKDGSDAENTKRRIDLLKCEKHDVYFSIPHDGRVNVLLIGPHVGFENNQG